MKAPLKLALIFACGAAFAAPNSVPPPPEALNGPDSVSQMEADALKAAKKEVRRPSSKSRKTVKDPKIVGDRSLAPGPEDFEKAREKRAQEKGKEEKREGDTTIEVRRNQNGEVVEYVVTPGATSIPYTVKPKSPNSPSLPGHNDTLETPSLIKLEF